MLEADFDNPASAVELGGVATEAGSAVEIFESVFEFSGGGQDFAADEPGFGVVGIDSQSAIEVCGTKFRFTELPADFATQTPGGG